MCPQKWNASAACARRAAATNPPPVTARSRRATPARKPRRDVASTTAPLKPRSDSRRLRAPGPGGEQSLELDQRVERSLRDDGAAAVEDDAVRAAGNRERAPDVLV